MKNLWLRKFLVRVRTSKGRALASELVLLRGGLSSEIALQGGSLESEIMYRGVCANFEKMKICFLLQVLDNPPTSPAVNATGTIVL